MLRTYYNIIICSIIENITFGICRRLEIHLEFDGTHFVVPSNEAVRTIAAKQLNVVHFLFGSYALFALDRTSSVPNRNANELKTLGNSWLLCVHHVGTNKTIIIPIGNFQPGAAAHNYVCFSLYNTR